MAMSDEMRQCVDNALTCYRVCMETLTYCLDQGGEHAKTAHIELLLNCAEVCNACAGLMLRGGSNVICGPCADLCEQCAADCRRFNDPNMQACIDACRQCAQSCRKMAA